jgi:PAS domain-containing protein
VPHVELSLSEPQAIRARPSPRSSLGRWAEAVANAGEASLMIDADHLIVALSPTCQVLLGLDRPAVGENLLDVVHLLDFSGSGGALGMDEVGKIPPLLAIASGRLARGLLRVECREGPCTLDAITTPLLGRMGTAGSLTFFSPI